MRPTSRGTKATRAQLLSQQSTGGGAFQQHLLQQLWLATWTKLQAQYTTVRSIGVREKRVIFSIMRSRDQAPVTADTFLPHVGLFVGEFCVWQILADSVRDEEPAARAEPPRAETTRK